VKQKMFFGLLVSLSLCATEMAHARHRRIHYRSVEQQAVQPNFFGDTNPQLQRMTRAERRALAKQQAFNNSFGMAPTFNNPTNDNSFATYSGGGGTSGIRPGERCHAGDRDPIKCKKHARGASANGYLGFRSYGGHNCQWIGGNCYRRTTELERSNEPEPTTVKLDPTMTAEDVDAQATQNLEHMAEIQSDIGAG